MLPPSFKNYVTLVETSELIDALQQSIEKVSRLVTSLPEHQGEFRYQAEKWSIKEVLCHMMDAERIFAYRALRFARNDATALHGFEENDYAPLANAHSRTLRQLLDEMKRLRTTTLDLFQSFTEEMLDRKGVANGVEASVATIGYLIAGHTMHHYNILAERYITKTV